MPHNDSSNFLCKNKNLSVLVILLLISTSSLVVSQSLDSLNDDAAASVPLNQVPFLMAHDAATTYRSSYSRLGDVVPGQVQTQPEGGFTDLLNCGVRAFDLRPCRDLDGELYMHHGAVKVKYPLKDALAEIIHWAGDHRDELIIIYFSHCGSGERCATDEREREQCESQSADLLKQLGIDLIQSVDMTLGEATEKAALTNGGRILALDQFSSTDDLKQVRENYEPSIRYCEGRRVKSDAISNLFSYMDTIAAQAPSRSELVVLQAHWQDPYTTLVDGCRDTVLQMESDSEINKQVSEAISAGRWRYINLLEVDNVCDQGLELKKALDSHFAKQIAGKQ